MRQVSWLTGLVLGGLGGALGGYAGYALMALISPSLAGSVGLILGLILGYYISKLLIYMYITLGASSDYSEKLGSNFKLVDPSDTYKIPPQQGISGIAKKGNNASGKRACTEHESQGKRH